MESSDFHYGIGFALPRPEDEATASLRHRDRGQEAVNILTAT